MTLKVKCPKCKVEVSWKDNKWRPFCSERCKMVDLGTWANEEYRISDDTEHVTIEDSSLGDDELV